MVEHEEALVRIATAMANALWRNMTTAQVLDMTDYEEEYDECSLWEALRRSCMEVATANFYQTVPFLLEPPKDQMKTERDGW